MCERERESVSECGRESERARERERERGRVWPKCSLQSSLEGLGFCRLSERGRGTDSFFNSLSLSYLLGIQLGLHSQETACLILSGSHQELNLDHD